MKFKSINIETSYPFGYQHGARAAHAIVVEVQTGERDWQTTQIRLDPERSRKLITQAVILAGEQLTKAEITELDEFLNGREPDPEQVAKAEEEERAKAEAEALAAANEA